METRHVVHPFAPIINASSKLLVLGSIPSVASVDGGFYYMHPRNRFWPLMSALLGEDFVAMTSGQKSQALLSRGIALYDAVCECDIVGSADGKLTGAVPTDIPALLAVSQINRVYCNGDKAYQTVIRRYPDLPVEVVRLPSTSPANAGSSFVQLLEQWKQIIE